MYNKIEEEQKLGEKLIFGLVVIHNNAIHSVLSDDLAFSAEVENIGMTASFHREKGGRCFAHKAILLSCIL